MKNARTLDAAALAAAGLDYFPVPRDWLDPKDRERKRAELADVVKKRKEIDKATRLQVRPGEFKLRAEHRNGEIVSIKDADLRAFVEEMASEDSSWKVTRQLQTTEEQRRTGVADSANSHTPELALALRAYHHFWAKQDPAGRLPKSEIIILWLREQLPGLSNNMADAIDALIRPLYARKGGQKKLPTLAKGPAQKG